MARPCVEYIAARQAIAARSTCYSDRMVFTDTYQTIPYSPNGGVRGPGCSTWAALVSECGTHTALLPGRASCEVGRCMCVEVLD